ncbi:unnamed protein product [Moneuplotes crassus]|uniref:Uncharacterized protein n=1 Tax=Euplotes crassus TaxID=5936 RepID=A0AAD1XJN1_EUPCR|nr:unnamed protein product [Moneuplotes crassus]
MKAIKDVSNFDFDGEYLKDHITEDHITKFPIMNHCQHRENCFMPAFVTCKEKNVNVCRACFDRFHQDCNQENHKDFIVTYQTDSQIFYKIHMNEEIVNRLCATLDEGKDLAYYSLLDRNSIIKRKMAMDD